MIDITSSCARYLRVFLARDLYINLLLLRYHVATRPSWLQDAPLKIDGNTAVGISRKERSAYMRRRVKEVNVKIRLLELW